MSFSQLLPVGKLNNINFSYKYVNEDGLKNLTTSQAELLSIILSYLTFLA